MADESAAAAAATRPQKPDEALFKEKSAKAEKEHAQVMAQYVCLLLCPYCPLVSLIYCAADSRFPIART